MQMLREHPQRLLSSSHSWMASTWSLSQDRFHQTSQEPFKTYAPAVEHLQQRASPSFTKVTGKVLGLAPIILTSHMDIATTATACLEQGPWVEWGSVSLTTWPGNEERCCCSVAQLCLTLWDPTGCNMQGFPVLHSFPEFAQTHVHWVSDAIQPSHPLLSPSLFPSIKVFSKWIASLHLVAKVLELQLQHQSFQWIFKVCFL